MKTNYNGTFTDAENASISVNNRGLHFGDSVFETLRYSGGKIFFWEDHYFRLMSAMRILRMEIPMDFTPEQLEAEIIKTITASDAEKVTCRVRITVWRQWGGKYNPSNQDIEYMIQLEKLDAPFYTISDEPYEIELYKDHYVNSGLLSTLKTNNKIINVLGSVFATENGYKNCLLLNENKMVVEALNGNIFLVNGYKIKTPPLEDGCLKGVLRKQIIDIIGAIPDYVLEETTVSPFELQKADEIFITNVIGGIQPVTKYRKKTFDNTVAKELLAKLNVKARLG
ncbi:MAG: aminotransferase class IV [Flavobacteriaceae bacterium]|nr:aminotransferase class IV [Flavobacteriaceae bacterium]